MNEVARVQNIPKFIDIYEAFLSWPTQTQIGIIMSAAIWLIGGNVVFYFSMRRRGIPYWKVLIPSFKTTFGLNGKEWMILAALAFASLLFGMWGINEQY